MKLTKYIADIQKIGTREKLTIALLLSISFTIGFSGAVLIGSTNLKINISTNNSPTPTSAPALATLSLTTDRNKITTGSTFDVFINIDSPDRPVEAGDFIVYFDPKYIKPQKIINGDFFSTYPVKKIESNLVKISTTATFINNKIIVPMGKGTIASITFMSIAPADDTLIYFDPDATIVASNGNNSIRRMSSLNMTIIR